MGNKSGKAKGGDSKSSNQGSSAGYAQLKVLAKGSHFNIGDVRQLHAKFKKLAAASDNPDEIHHHQWKECAREAGITGADIYLEQLWNAFDNNRSNTIGFREFVLGLSAICRGTAREKLELSFEVYDVENNGRISKEEMTRLLSRMDNHALDYLGSSKGSSLKKRQEAESKALKEQRHEAIATFVDHVFEENDATRNGYLSMSEYTQAVLKHPALLSYRADTNVLKPVTKKQIGPQFDDASDEEPTGPATTCANCIARDEHELALIALVSDMKSVISEQQRKINSLEWDIKEGSEVLQLRAQVKKLRAAPIEGGRHGFIAYGVKKGYIMYDDSSHRITML